MKFSKLLLTNVLAIFISFFLIFFMLFLFVVGSSSDPEPHVKKNTILKIDVSGGISERTLPPDPFEELLGQNKDGDRVSLESLKENLEKAAIDDRIEGVWLVGNSLGTSWPELEQARGYLKTFKEESGKFLIASSDDIGYDERFYYLASVADSVYAYPESFFEFDGFYLQTTFFKGLFDKVGIEPEFTRFGKYKSAIEPFIQKKYSTENREQLNLILGAFADEYLSAVMEKTGKSKAELNNAMNELNITSAAALSNGLVDALLYEHQIEQLLKDKLGVKSFKTISNRRYARVSVKDMQPTQAKDQIAVLYLSGEIMPFADESPLFGGSDVITATKFRKDFNRLIDDKNVKAIVLRINSPGGSGSTSDAIYADILEGRKKKPVIASMGYVAASGGYYIAAPADTIVAHPTTITGSIGVFAQKFNAQKMLNENIGLDFDVVKTHKNADWFLLNQGLTKEQAAGLQRYVDSFYDVFLTLVSKNRNMSKDAVHEIAQGRVWTGRDAHKLGLVDVLGDLNTAISIAAEKAGVEDYRVSSFPRTKTFMEQLTGSTQTKVSTWLNGMGMFSEEMHHLKRVMNDPRRDVQALLPLEFEIR